MNIHEINPYIHHANYSTMYPANNINTRIILDYELIYIEDGEVLLTYNGTPFHFSRGDILLLCPNIPHSFTVPTYLVQPHIHFDLSYDSMSSRRFVSYRNRSALTAEEQLLISENVFPQLSASPLLVIHDRQLFLKNFFSVIQSPNHHSIECKIRMLGLLNQVIAENIDANSHNIDESTPNIAAMLKDYIDANYENNFQLVDLEKQFCYSRYYLDRLFAKENGTSIIKYRNQLRMINALSLPKKHSVTEVAERLGYSSIYTFNHAFRSYYHESPSDYLHRQGEEKKPLP